MSEKEIKIKDTPRLIMYAFELAIAVFGAVYLALALSGIGMEMVPEAARFASGVATFFLGIALIAIELIFRYKLPLMLHVIYAGYIFFSNVLGSCLGLFRYMIDTFIWRGVEVSDFGWFDKIMHSILGYVLCVVAVYLAIKCKIWNMSIMGDLLIILAISMGFASLWEIFEFTMDSILVGQDMQRGPHLLDTMIDMTLHLIFTVVFMVQYGLGKATKYSFGMNFMVANLSTGGSTRKSKNEVKNEVINEVKNEDINEVIYKRRYKRR